MWKEWFSFSRGERYGIIILFLLVCVAALFPYIHKSVFHTTNPLAQTDIYYKVDSFLTSLKYEKPKPEPRFSFADEEKPKANVAELFQFDPNTASASELVRLGFTKRQTAVIERYRERGGAFRAPDDFAKIYVVDSGMFSRLKPYINIAPLPGESDVAPSDTPTIYLAVPEHIMVEINSADTIELVKLKGIGRGYARRIIAYRQLLGGFRSVNQLSEVYGITSTIVESIMPNIEVDTFAIQKINLNFTDYNELRKHPYLTDYQARAIIYYRETVGNINSLNDLVTNKLIDKSTFSKVKGYITIN